MSEDNIIDLWIKELSLNTWSDELLGNQKASSGSPVNIDLAKKSMPWTQLVTAEVIKEKLGNYLSYVSSTKTWYAWNGLIHEPCTGEDIALNVVKKYFKEYSAALSVVEKSIELGAQSKIAQTGVSDSDDVKNIRKLYTEGFARQRKMRENLASTQGREQVVKAMRTEFKVADDYFDHDKDYLVVRNCVFDLKHLRTTGSHKAIKHSPDLPVTRFMDIEYDRSAKFEGSTFLRYLFDVLPDDDNKGRTEHFLRKVMGAAFMGESRTRTIINVLGPPGSGKSNFIDMFMKLGSKGSSYVTSPDTIAIMKTTGTNFEQDQFRNKRFIAISEPSSTDHVDDEFLKRFTGEDWVMTRTLNSKSSGWSPQGLLFIASNGPLKINSRDEATVQRIKVIEFPHRFVDNPTKAGEKKIDRDLSRQLVEESSRSEILNWLLSGMLEYVKDGKSLTPPSYITEQQAKISNEASASLRWLSDMKDSAVLVSAFESENANHYQDSAYITLKEAYRLFKLWCAEVGEFRILPRRLFEEDVSKHHPSFKYGNEVRLRGLVKTNNAPRESMSDMDREFMEKVLSDD